MTKDLANFRSYCAKLWIFCFVLAQGTLQAEDETFLYAVQLSAQVQTNPARISLSWPADPYGATNYTVYRKAKTATSWGAPTFLPGTATNYVDTAVANNSSYEYKVTKAATLGYMGYGYLYAGINAPLVDTHGKIVLVVATNSTASLAAELTRLQSDLMGDGWTVLRHDVSTSDTPDKVKAFIVADYQADPANVNTVFLFGHVPILQSGYLNYDGHLTRSMPADAFYGDIDGDWKTSLVDSNRPSYLPTDVELMVGRVDLFDMPGVGAPVAWPNETELLRNYLNKDHKWRHKLMTVPRRALMGNLRGDEGGEATAASGYRNFDPLVGPGNTWEANVEYAAPPEQRWISILGANSFLWAYGCGAGQPTAVSGLGTADGTFYDVRSIDVVSLDAKAVFVMLFGSWFGEWDYSDDLMRSFLATPTMGLACCMAGRPHWYLHHMGLGETIGYGTRLSMNNSTLYENDINAMTRAVYVALMGDPTLRQDIVTPPANLSAAFTANVVNLTWSPSPDASLGYHVYRATSSTGPFTRLTAAPITQTNYTDLSISSNSYTYMVRAIALQTGPSGSYQNPSQSAFATVNVNIPISIRLVGSRTNNGIGLSWNSFPGITYRVQARSSVDQGTWADISGTLTATNNTCSWIDTNALVNSRRFYRIANP